VEHDFSGPARVSGSAGTGKTADATLVTDPAPGMSGIVGFRVTGGATGADQFFGALLRLGRR
jgi:hypothetical protein